MPGSLSEEPRIPPESRGLARYILDSLDSIKAEEIVCIDLADKSDIADCMIIASGRSSRQVTSISERLVECLKTKIHRRIHVEGAKHGDWVLIDAGDIIVHVFRPEVREFYQLEKLWMPTIQQTPAN